MRKLAANACLAVYMSVMLMMIALFARVDVLIPFTQLLLPQHHLMDKLVLLLSERTVILIFIIYNDLNQASAERPRTRNDLVPVLSLIHI